MQLVDNKIVNKKSYQHRAVVMGISVLLPPFWKVCLGIFGIKKLIINN